MNILITGGTGFIGSELCPFLLKKGHYVKIITRSPEKHRDEEAENQQFISLDSDFTEPMEWADAVINLAGENIFGQRWSDEVKQEIYSSRIEITKSLVQAIEKAGEPPEVMISGSAVGYYGNRGPDIITEDTTAKNEPVVASTRPTSNPEAGRGNTTENDFLAKVCVDWERAAKPVEKEGVRLVISRTGIVLEKEGGVLKQMLPVFKYFMGGAIGSGNQFISWIHRRDLCRAFNFFLSNKKTQGAFNASAPNPVTMDEFAKSLANVLNRPSFFRVPEWALKMALSEAADPVLESLRVQPARLLQSDFEFKYSFLRDALSDIL